MALKSLYRNIQSFIKQVNEVHQSRYEYEELKTFDRITYRTWIPIECKVHGTFKQKARTHLVGSGCPSCAHESRELKYYSKNRHSLKVFVDRAQKVHGTKYDYSKSIYQGQMHPIDIICPDHGTFSQVANNHVHGNGCPRCKDSRGERLVAQILDTHNIKYERQKQFKDCFNPNNKNRKPLMFDFYVPDFNVLIEYDGKHHYEPVPFRGVTIEKAKSLHQRTIDNDQIKDKYARQNGISLLRIPYTDDLDVIEEKITVGLQ